MGETPILERLVAKDRQVTLAGVFVLWVLAWVYIAMGAGLGMSAGEMTTLALFPHQEVAALVPMAGDGMDAMVSVSTPAARSGFAGWILSVAMWWVMMIAMMAPSAAPTILLYARVYRHSSAQDHTLEKLAPTSAFAGGYVLIWLFFSVAAAIVYRALETSGLLSAMGSRNQWLSAGVLVSAGAYQFSPLKTACLAHCRSPAEFLSRYWRPHAAGAWRLGVMHGAYCVGCCWVLMALLFVGGAMNLVWIAVLSFLVLVEKFMTPGRWVARGTGLVLIGWGLATVLV